MVDSSIEQLNAHRQECLCYGSFSANRKERVTAKKLKPVHPGEILREEFMAPLELSMNKMAMALRVPVTRIADIVNERRGITADTALRFARYFKNSPAFWMNVGIALRARKLETQVTCQEPHRPQSGPDRVGIDRGKRHWHVGRPALYWVTLGQLKRLWICSIQSRFKMQPKLIFTSDLTVSLIPLEF